LDSFGAERVMKAVKNIAARGTPVVCTIHQPSATLFSMFTHLLLLKKGGYTTYFGPIGDRPGDCSVMLDYFAGALGREIKPFQNPAEFILEVTGSGTHTRTHTHAHAYAHARADLNPFRYLE
jgi:ABC-type multidrug transport system ATPase subunit